MKRAKRGKTAISKKLKEDRVTIALDGLGRLRTKSQLADYIQRGHALQEDNIISFFLNTFEGQADEKTRLQLQGAIPIANTPCRGRPRNNRVQYLQDHPEHASKIRVRRREDHNMLPNFVGPPFPRNDDKDSRELYSACMLMLLKPWRYLEVDLKEVNETWHEAFDKFINSAPDDVRNIVSNIQYFHQCEAAARQSAEVIIEHDTQEMIEMEEDIPRTEVIPNGGGQGVVITEMPTREDIHALLAVEKAKQARVFDDESDCWDVKDGRQATVGSAESLLLLQEWKTQMESDVNAFNQARSNNNIPDDEGQTLGAYVDGGDPGARVIPLLETDNRPGHTTEPTMEVSEQALTSINPSMLKDDQYRAYDIITWHLDQTLAGANPPPLRFIIHGEGGTGKSKVIQTVTEYFKCRGAGHMLLKSAYTGIAASLIEGKTMHSIAMISQAKSHHTLSDNSKCKLQIFWKDYTYLVIDEMSMISKSFLAQLSRIISSAKATGDSVGQAASFGGINVILCGDFHQFPPVASPPNEALYFPAIPQRDSVDALIGRTIYEEFELVVLLKEQIRCTDPVWLDFLQHLRYGRVQEQHIHMLRRLVLGDSNASPTDFATEPWQDASLVTPRHKVRI